MTEAGWYRDPMGQTYRWWTGGTWSGWFSDGRGVWADAKGIECDRPEPPVVPPRASTAYGSPIIQGPTRTWAMVLLEIQIAIIVIAALGASVAAVYVQASGAGERDLSPYFAYWAVAASIAGAALIITPLLVARETLDRLAKIERALVAVGNR